MYSKTLTQIYALGSHAHINATATELTVVMKTVPFCWNPALPNAVSAPLSKKLVHLVWCGPASPACSKPQLCLKGFIEHFPGAFLLWR